jgi:hypothetical protein
MSQNPLSLLVWLIVLHPMCTLSFSPVVSRETRIVVPDIPPSLERVPALA